MLCSASTGDHEDSKNADIDEINKDLGLHEGDIQLMTVRDFDMNNTVFPSSTVSLNEHFFMISKGHDRNVILADELKWEIPVPYVLDGSLGN